MIRTGEKNLSGMRMKAVSSLLAASFFLTSYSGVLFAADDQDTDVEVFVPEETAGSSFETEESFVEETVPEETIPETTEASYLSEDTGSSEPLCLTYEAESEDGIAVTAYVPEGAFDTDVTLTVEDIDPDDVIDDVNEVLGDDNQAEDLIAVDICFIDPDGNETEPDDDYSIDISIELPEDTELQGDEFTIIHLDDEGDGEEIDDADVTSTEALFSTDSFSIFVMTAVELKDKDEINAYIDTLGAPDQYVTPDNYYQNCHDHPYYLCVGETVEIYGHVDALPDGMDHISFSFSDDNPWFVNNCISMTQENKDLNGNDSPYYVHAVITGLDDWYEAFSVIIDGTSERFWVKVIDPEIQETVLDLDTCPDYNGNDDTITEIHVPFHGVLKLIGTPRNPDNYPYTNDDPSLTTVLGSGSENGRNYTEIIADQYFEDNHSQYYGFETPNDTYKLVRVIVDQPSGYLDHADIEIADGGVYTAVSFELGENGMVKTVTEYQSFVSKVNYCYLYQEDGSLVNFFERYEHDNSYYIPWATISCVPLDDSECGFFTDDYWCDENRHPGDSQYELTSKYYYEDGNPNYIMNHKKYYYGEVETAEFSVGIDIVPLHSVQYRWDESTQNWVEVEDSEIHYTIDYEARTAVKTQAGQSVVVNLTGDDGITENIPDAVFELNHQAVIDAYNKCPNHSGLDFTIHANSALVQFKATKELTGGTLQADEFTFELVETDANWNPLTDGNGNLLVEPVTNDANGVITFELRRYESQEDHYFIIRERDESSSHPDIRYDDTLYKITVNVIEDPLNPGIYYANVVEKENNYTFKFVNEVKMYELPETGGVGVLPLYITGIILIAAPVLVRTRPVIIFNNNKKSRKGRKKKL